MNVGTFVRYRLSDLDVRGIKFRRARAVGWAGDHEIKAGDDFPAMVIKVVAVGILDLRVFLNGTDDLWKPNAPQPALTDDGKGNIVMADDGRGAWFALPTEETAPPDPPEERVLKVNPGDAPRTVKTRKETADV